MHTPHPCDDHWPSFVTISSSLAEMCRRGHFASAFAHLFGEAPRGKKTLMCQNVAGHVAGEAQEEENKKLISRWDSERELFYDDIITYTH